MSQTNVELIQGIYAAFSTGDVPALLGAMDPAIVWNEAENFPYADGNPYIGAGAVAAGVFARCGAEWDGFGVVIEEIIDAGDTIIALGRYVGTYKATGKAQHTQMAHIWRCAEGKAVRFQQLADTLHVARVTGKA